MEHQSLSGSARGVVGSLPERPARGVVRSHYDLDQARAYAESIARSAQTVEQTRAIADQSMISGLAMTSRGDLPAGVHALTRSLVASAFAAWQLVQLSNEAFSQREHRTAHGMRANAESLLRLLPDRARLASSAMRSTMDGENAIGELRATAMAFVIGSGIGRAIFDGARFFEWQQELLDAFTEIVRGEDETLVSGLGVPRLALSGRAGDGKRQTGRGARPALSIREREVLGQIVGGLTTAEIAYRLGVKTTTVATLVGRIFNKLGVNNRPAAVALALRYGLCSTADDGHP